MAVSRSIVLTTLLAVVGLSSVGCTDWEKKYKELNVEYQDLTAKYNGCQDQLQAVRMQASESQTAVNDLRMQLNSTQSELARTRSDLQDAQAKLSEGGPEPGPGPIEVGEGRPLYKETVGSDVLFSAGRATLTAAGQRALDSVVSTLKVSYAGHTVRVYGYTDSDPIVKTKKLWQDNLDLSANRAMAVTRYLISRGIDADRVETVAMGETNPVASNATKAGKAKNRRVEIIVVK